MVRWPQRLRDGRHWVYGKMPVGKAVEVGTGVEEGLRADEKEKGTERGSEDKGHCGLAGKGFFEKLFYAPYI